MNREKGAVFYKSADPNWYKPGKEFNTSTYNYELVVPVYSEGVQARFDEFIEDSAKTGNALSDYTRSVTDKLEAGGNEIGAQVFQAAFREYFIEKVRRGARSDAPSRQESVFACSELSHVHEFHKRAPRKSAVIVTLEVVQWNRCFEGDMALLDQYENFHNCETARRIVEAYWRGEQSAAPCPELLLQGCFRWGEPAK